MNFKRIMRLFCCVTLIMTLFASVAGAASLEQKKAEVQHKVDQALGYLYEEEPSAQYQVENSDGYAVFVCSGYKLGIFGSSHGRGMAVNNATGEKTYMRMGDYNVGLGIGAKEYAVVFVFKSQQALSDFINSGWKFNGDAEAAAKKNSQNGGEAGGIINVGHDVYLYQVTTKGLVMELGLRGTEYYKDKSFYPKK